MTQKLMLPLALSIVSLGFIVRHYDTSPGFTMNASTASERIIAKEDVVSKRVPVHKQQAKAKAASNATVPPPRSSEPQKSLAAELPRADKVDASVPPYGYQLLSPQVATATTPDPQGPLIEQGESQKREQAVAKAPMRLTPEPEQMETKRVEPVNTTQQLMQLLIE